MSRFDLVIFDCDGVLVDSEKITNRVFCGMLNELGLVVTLSDMFEKFVGRSTDQCLAIITQLLGQPPPDGFFEEYQRRARQALAAEVVAMPGIETALDGIGLPYCVASSGELAKIELTLGTTGLLSRFEGRIFSVGDVQNPKPAPDIYLLAARTLGIAPARCAVIEDTPTGAAAGVAAGMQVFGFASYTPRRWLVDAGAQTIFSDMAALPELLEDFDRD